MTTNQYIALIVKKYREQQKLTVPELAQKSNLHKTYVYAIEAGEANITISKLEQICDALNIHITDVLPSKPTADTSENKDATELLAQIKDERDKRLLAEIVKAFLNQ